MNIKNEINKVLTKIAKQIYKRLKLPKDVKKYISAETFSYPLCIKWFYAGVYFYTLQLKPDYYDCTEPFESVSWLTTKLQDEVVKYASDKALKELANHGHLKEKAKELCVEVK